MSPRILALLFFLAGLTTNCQKNKVDRIPPALSGRTWDLSTRTVVKSDATGTTSTTTAVPSGVFSVAYLGNGVYNLSTGGATVTGTYDYDGKVITFYGAVGASHTRVMTITSLTDTQLVTVEQTQDTNSQYTATDTYKSL